MELQILLLFAQLFLVFGQEPIIDTSNGKVQGKVIDFDDKQYTAFYSIPFAAAPVGKLRFKPPQAHAGWGDTVYAAQTIGPWCPQQRGVEDMQLPYFPKRLVEYTLDEDCLHLNVFVPGDVSKAKEGSLPVTVFIHGGGFIAFGPTFQLEDVLVTQDEPMIVVTIQYRLSTLGFMTTGDEVLPGNLGLKDQAFALKWVQKNIREFGGDPNHVTICGQSAGGESVLAHMISPMSKGLFHKASAQSSPYAWIYPRKELLSGYFKEFAKALDCEGSSEQAIECLQGKPWEDLVTTEILESPYSLLQRVIDGEFITDEPRKLWANGAYHDADLMVGFTSNDGGMLPISIVYTEFLTNRSSDLDVFRQAAHFTLAALLADDFGFSIDSNKLLTRGGKVLSNSDELKTMLKGRYYDSAANEIAKAQGILDMSRDGFFAMFALFCANHVARNGGTVYSYMFDHRCDDYASSDLPVGADHGSEIPFQFGYGFTDPEEVNMTEPEFKLSRSVIKALISFASGKPQYLTIDEEEVEWSAYTPTDKNILVFDTNMSKQSMIDGEDYFQPVLEFWLALDSLARFEDPGQSDDDEAVGTPGKEEL